MQDKTKYRLTGLAVMALSLAVIYPVFLTGEGYAERQIDPLLDEMPQAPAIIDIEVSPEVVELVETTPAGKAVSLPEVESPAAVQAAPEAPVLSAQTQEAQQARAPKVDLAEAPRLDETGVPVAWSLQLGTFSNEENAKRLERELVDKGHKVYTRRAGDFVQLFVGPDLQKARLEQLKAKIDKELSLKSKLVRFSTQ